MKIKEALNILDLLKYKKVQLTYIAYCKKQNLPVSSYNDFVSVRNELTQEEFDKIKEWLYEGED